MSQPGNDDALADVEAQAIQRFIAEGSTPDAGWQWLDNARRLLNPSTYLLALRFRAESHVLAWDECLRIAELFEEVDDATSTVPGNPPTLRSATQPANGY